MRGLQRIPHGPGSVLDSILDRLQVVLDVADFNTIVRQRHDLSTKIGPVLRMISDVYCIISKSSAYLGKALSQLPKFGQITGGVVDPHRF